MGGEVQSLCVGAFCSLAWKEDKQTHSHTHGQSIRGSFHKAPRHFMACFPWFWICNPAEVLGNDLLRRSVSSVVGTFTELWLKYGSKRKNKAVGDFW